MTIDVATGLARILKQEGVEWVSTFPVCKVNNALGREGMPLVMMRDDRYAVALADAFSRITASQIWDMFGLSASLKVLQYDAWRSARHGRL